MSRDAPEFVTDELTGQYSGEDLRAARRKRPTDKRLEKLEEKHDAIDAKVDDIGNRVARMEGKLDTALSVIVPERQQVHATHRAKIDSRTKIIIAIGGAICTLIGVVITAMSGCA